MFSAMAAYWYFKVIVARISWYVFHFPEQVGPARNIEKMLSNTCVSSILGNWGCYVLFWVAARVLATYLIPGCAGRGVRLGSESSSGGAGAGAAGIWKSGNLEIWKILIF